MNTAATRAGRDMKHQMDWPWPQKNNSSQMAFCGWFGRFTTAQEILCQPYFINGKIYVKLNDCSRNFWRFTATGKELNPGGKAITLSLFGFLYCWPSIYVPTANNNRKGLCDGQVKLAFQEYLQKWILNWFFNYFLSQFQLTVSIFLWQENDILWGRWRSLTKINCNFEIVKFWYFD